MAGLEAEIHKRCHGPASTSSRIKGPEMAAQPGDEGGEGGAAHSNRRQQGSAQVVPAAGETGAQEGGTMEPWNAWVWTHRPKSIVVLPLTSTRLKLSVSSSTTWHHKAVVLHESTVVGTMPSLGKYCKCQLLLGTDATGVGHGREIFLSA